MTNRDLLPNKIYLIVDRVQGQELKKHKEKNGQFYSGWKAAGIGAVCMVVILAGIFGYAFLSPDDFSDTGIPAWQKNLQILDELDSIEGLYKEFKDQNQVLREYCKLRIESYQLIRKAITEDTNSYDLQIEEINKKIAEVLKVLTFLKNVSCP